jgi:sugar lactone lactonase YvrE
LFGNSNMTFNGTTLAVVGAASVPTVTVNFNQPNGVAVLPNGNIVVADTNNHRIRLVTQAGVVTTLAGSGSPAFADGTGAAASFNGPIGVAVIPSSGVIVVADRLNHRIRLVTQAGVVTTLAGSGQGFADGTGTAASFDIPVGVAVTSTGVIVVADYLNHRIRLVTTATYAANSGVVTTLAGNGTPAFADGTGATATFNQPHGVAVLPNNDIIMADRGNGRIRLVTLAGVVTTLAGSDSTGSLVDGTGTAAKFFGPTAVAVLPSGVIVVADSLLNRIRLVTTPTYGLNSGVVTTIAGSGTATFADGTGAAASFNTPIGVAVITSSGLILVADRSNNRIRYVTASGVVTTLTTYDHIYALTIAGDVDVGSNVNVRGGYYVNGVQLAGGSAIATYSNSGAVLLADGTSTGLRGNSNLFFSNNTSLGIQTTTPVTALDVNGGVTIRNGLRPLYSNVITGSLSSGVYTVPANAYGTHFNITTTAITGITIPTVTGATDSNAYWVFRNNTGTYESITFTYTTAGTTFPTNPVTIPPANSVVLMVTFPSSVLGYVLF